MKLFDHEVKWHWLLTIIIHIAWHIAFFMSNLSALIIGIGAVNGCSKHLAIWAITYGSFCSIYYSYIVVRLFVSFVKEQAIDSNTEALFQTIKSIQAELGMDVSSEDEEFDLNQINIGLSNSSTEKNYGIMKYIQLFIGLVLVLALCFGCIFVGMTQLNACNNDVYMVSCVILILTLIKVLVYVIKSIQQ
jgi:hypothetical protein